MKYEGNPFFWGFNEQRSIETLAQQTNATYNNPRETAEKNSVIDNFFHECFGVSPNPAFITGATALDPLPYRTPDENSKSENEEECKEDTDTLEEKESEDTEKKHIDEEKTLEED